MKVFFSRMLWVTLLVCACFSFSLNAQIFPDQIRIPVTYFDFHSDKSCPEFQNQNERSSGRALGLVDDTLDADGLPVRGPNCFFSYFVNKWYREWKQGDDTQFPVYDNATGQFQSVQTVQYDTTFRNVKVLDSLTFAHQGGGVYQFTSNTFFPLNDRGLGNEGRANNFSFTTMVVHEFRFTSGLTFTFSGDDDVWVFINGRKALDIGGIHGVETASFNLDILGPQLGLELGKKYIMRVFHAERKTTASNFTITTNIIGPDLDNLSIKAQPDDTVRVGESVFGNAVIRTTEGRDTAIGKLPGTVTWGFSDPTGKNAASTFTTNKDSMTFTPTHAFTTVTIWARYTDTGVDLRDTIEIVVIAGVPDHLVIEASPDRPADGSDALYDDKPLNTVTISSNQMYNQQFYAILRDVQGNWIGPANPATWSSDNTDVATAKSGTEPAKGQGRADRKSMDISGETDVKGAYDYQGKELSDKIHVIILGQRFGLLTATYLDTSSVSDGYIDAIQVTVDDSLKNLMKNDANADVILGELAKTISLPAWREFLDNTKVFVKNDEGFTIYVQQDKSKVAPNTAVDPAKDILTFSTTNFNEMGFIAEGQITIDDGLGPIIIKAIFNPLSVTANGDTAKVLIVTFSENVNVPISNQPFTLNYKNLDGVVTQYTLTLDLSRILSGGDNSATIAFKVDAVVGKTYPVNGDSIWIKAGGMVEDNGGVKQTKTTVHVPLEVKNIPNKTIATVLGPIFPGKPFEDDLINTLKLRDEKVNPSGVLGGTVVLIEIFNPILPNDRWRGEMFIYDAVGNTIADDIEGRLVQVFDSKLMKERAFIVYVWSGKNQLGRNVGMGSYLAVANSYKNDEVFKTNELMIGVKSGGSE